MSPNDSGRAESLAKPTRGEIETLCVIFAVGDGCAAAELTVRLGFSPTLVDAVASAAMTLVERGLLEFEGELFTATDAGIATLASRLQRTGG